NKLIKMHMEMAKAMKQIRKMGGLKGLAAMFGGGGLGGGMGGLGGGDARPGPGGGMGGGMGGLPGGLPGSLPGLGGGNMPANLGDLLRKK
ncbi:MAG: signal recognition particle protein, partial [Novosphingobium sp.]|nr:signal recognition particle protein [Novosphingobium sp.]